MDLHPKKHYVHVWLVAQIMSRIFFATDFTVVLGILTPTLTVEFGKLHFGGEGRLVLSIPGLWKASTSAEQYLDYVNEAIFRQLNIAVETQYSSMAVALQQSEHRHLTIQALMCRELAAIAYAKGAQ